MVRAETSEAPARWGELLAAARSGEEVLLTEGELDAFRIVPLARPGATHSDLEIMRRQPKLTREMIERAGFIPPKNEERKPLPPPVQGGTGSLVETLLKMRDEEYKELGIE